MSDLLAAGYIVIGGGGLTYTYTDFELTAEAGYITIDAPDLESGLSSQTMFPAVGYVTIGGGSANLSFKDWSAELATGYVTIGAGTTQLREVARVLFPALSPSSRNFTPPEYAVSKYKTMNGAKSYRLWASQPGGGVLDLEFVNLDDDDAERICAAHDLAKGSTNDLILPDEVLFGVEGDLLQYMKRAVPSRTTPAISWSGYAYGTVLSNVIPGIPDSLPDEVFWYNPSNLFYKGQEISSPQAWSFDGPPEVQSVKEGISTVRVRLSARRKLRFESVGSIGLGAAFAVPATMVDEIDPGSFNDCDVIGPPLPPPPSSDCVLILNMEGANGSTTFIDSSVFNHSVTAVGNAQILNNELLLDGDGSYLVTQESNEFVLGLGNFSIKGYIQYESEGYDGYEAMEVFNISSNSAIELFEEIRLYVDRSTDFPSEEVVFTWSLVHGSGGEGNAFIGSYNSRNGQSNAFVSPGEKVDFEVVRDNNGISFKVRGARLIDVFSGEEYVNYQQFNFSGNRVRVGAYSHPFGYELPPFNGKIDNFEICKLPAT